MATVMVKCRYCGKSIEKDTAYNSGVKGHYYCTKKCFDERERERLGENKSKARDKIKYKPKEGSSRREFTDYCQWIILDENGIDKNIINWAQICSHAKNLLDKYERWSYDTLIFILQYMKEIAGVQGMAKREYGYDPLNLVEYYAKEAEQYWNDSERVREAIENFDFTNNVRVVKQSHRKKKVKLLDFD